MIKVGNVLKNKTSGRHYVVITPPPIDGAFETIGYDGLTYPCHSSELDTFDVFDSILDVLPVPLATPSPLDTQLQAFIEMWVGK